LGRKKNLIHRLARNRKLHVFVYVALTLLALDVGSCLLYPFVWTLKDKNPKSWAMLEYRQAQWRNAGRHVAVRRYWVPLSRVSPYVTKAVLIAEDDKFWTHEGFDFEAMEKALEKDVKKRSFKAGGSTISQQLAKNLYLSPSKDPIRKIKEAILTWRIERELKKRRILELYLNVAEWGPGIFGIEAASRYYYGVPASALGPEQAARLASVLPNPIRFSPTNPSRYVVRRSGIIYNIMVRRGIVMPEFEEVMRPEEPELRSPEGPPGEQPGPFMGVSTIR
jgi:monofunctional biosynthetic peptidoglycan transglycosylase